MQVSDSVRMVPVPETEPMRPTQTNIYIVGQPGGQVLTIDSGEAIDKFWWMLRGYLAAIDQSEIGVAAISHHHFDHSGNLKNAHEHLQAEVAVPENGVELLSGRLPDKDVRTFADGQELTLDNGVRVQIIGSPGHSVDSLCYYIEEDGVLFTGDTILGNTTTVVGDINSYMASLRRLLELPNIKVLCPGHGPLIRDTDEAKARDRLEMYVAHRQMREDQILEQLQGGETKTSWQIMEAIYADTIDKRLRRAADGNVQAHLESLRLSGVIQANGGVKKAPNPLRSARSTVRKIKRSAQIRQAKEYERQDELHAVAAQESPPTDQWETPPTYQLK